MFKLVALLVISFVVACTSESGPVHTRFRTSNYAVRRTEKASKAYAARPERLSGSESRLGSYTARPVRAPGSKGRVDPYAAARYTATPVQVPGSESRFTSTNAARPMEVTGSINDEVNALISFKRFLFSPQGLDDWNPRDSSPCHWTGVHCDMEENHVIYLSLPNMGLRGTINADLGNLSQLTMLLLNGNQLQGEIPSSLASCPLRKLDLSHNYLSGPIPTGGSFERMPAEWFGDNPNLCGQKVGRACY